MTLSGITLLTGNIPTLAQSIGHVNNIPTMQVITWISRNPCQNHNMSYDWPSVSRISIVKMHCEILMPYRACLCSKLPSHYFLISTNQLAVHLTECWITNQISTECCICIIRNFHWLDTAWGETTLSVRFKSSLTICQYSHSQNFSFHLHSSVPTLETFASI